MTPSLVNRLEKRGYRMRVVPVCRLHDLRETIETFADKDLLDAEFYQERLTHFDFHPPSDLKDARSLIIVAYWDPQVRLTFSRKGKKVRVVVPPTYLHWRKKGEEAGRVLADLLAPAGYRVVRAVVPEKLLAVCSGLAQYGKNNIVFVEGMGSFVSLGAFYSDLPSDEDSWRKPVFMDRCSKCRSCITHCPTGAIDPERFLIRAERCITYHNEKPGDVAFPDWLEPSGHNSLIGCMYCQRYCPENVGLVDKFEEGPAFSEEETTMILEGAPASDLSDTLKKKLCDWDLLDLLEYLPRNLSVLLGRNDQ